MHIYNKIEELERTNEELRYDLKMAEAQAPSRRLRSRHRI